MANSQVAMNGEGRAGDDRGELVAERRTAVAQIAGVKLSAISAASGKYAGSLPAAATAQWR